MQATYNIMIAERDIAFRDKLAGIIYDTNMHYPEFIFNVVQPASIEEIKAIFETTPPHIAFVDHLYFLHSPDELAALFEKAQASCELVMIVDAKDGDHINEILNNIDARRSLHLGGHLLKDNYSEDLVRVLVDFFIRRMETVK